MSKDSNPVARDFIQRIQDRWKSPIEAYKTSAEWYVIQAHIDINFLLKHIESLEAKETCRYKDGSGVFCSRPAAPTSQLNPYGWCQEHIESIIESS